MVTNGRIGVADMIITSTNLAEANTRYQALLGSLHDGIIMFDRNLEVLACNAAAEEILGLPREQMAGAGHGIWRWTQEGGAPATDRQHPAQQTLATGQPIAHVTMGLRRPDGTTRWISMSATPLFQDREAAPTSVVISFSDITVARLLEVERERTQRFHHSITDRLPLMIFYVDQDVVIRFANLAVCRCAGLEHDQVIGRTVRDIFGDSGFAADPNMLQEALCGRAIQRAVTVRRDNRDCVFNTSLFPDVVGGVTVGLHGLAADITEQFIAEQKARADEKVRVVGRLAAGVAHDFNNILQVILGSLSMLEEDPAIAARGDLGELTALARATAQRGAQLTHSLLSYTRQQVMRPTRVDLDKVLQDLRTLLSTTLSPRIAIDVDVQPNLPRVLVDHGQLETALLNLALNAAYAMPNGGKLRFEVRMAEAVQCGGLEMRGHVMIAVADTGPGLSASAMERAFEPFFTTKGVRGTGLGLAMVQGFCQQSGGDVRAMNPPEGGARIEILLPTHRASKTLLVEDTPDVLASLSVMLRRSGLETVTAQDGAEALERLARDPEIDMLITDYMMPGMTGIELVRRARLARPGLPALLITGYAEIDELAAEGPALSLLRKPFTRERLLSSVGALLRDPDDGRTLSAPPRTGRETLRL
jgi:PAS domain S-box-containing protein